MDRREAIGAMVGLAAGSLVPEGQCQPPAYEVMKVTRQPLYWAMFTDEYGHKFRVPCTLNYEHGSWWLKNKGDVEIPAGTMMAIVPGQ